MRHHNWYHTDVQAYLVGDTLNSLEDQEYKIVSVNFYSMIDYVDGREVTKPRYSIVAKKLARIGESHGSQ